MFASQERESESEPSPIGLSASSPQSSQHRTNFYYLLVVGLGFALIQLKQLFDGNTPTIPLNNIHLLVLILLFITALVSLWRNSFSLALEKGLFYILLVDYAILNHLSLLLSVDNADTLFFESIREDIWLLLALCVFTAMIFSSWRWRIVVFSSLFCFSVFGVVIWGVAHGLVLEMNWHWQLYSIAGLLMICIFILSRHRDSLVIEANALRDMRILANTDSLTNIANRRHIEEVLQHECERAKRYQNPLAVVIWDIDGFKEVNDQYGHSVGDEVLKAAAQHIASQLREVDILGRWGGEEFLCILPETKLEEAVLLGERLRSSLANLKVNDLPQITASFGVTANTKPGELNCTTQECKDGLIEKADKELYKAKQLGRNQVSPSPKI